MGDYCIGLGTPLGFSPIPASDRMRILFWPEKHNNTIPKCPQNGLAIAITRYSPYFSHDPFIVPVFHSPHLSGLSMCPINIDTMAFLKWVKKKSCGRFQGWLVVSNLLKHALLQYILLLFNVLYLWWFCILFTHLRWWSHDKSWDGFKLDSKHQLDIPIDYGWEVGLSPFCWMFCSREVGCTSISCDLTEQNAKVWERGDRTRNPLVNN